jgi:hypothetical protein
MNQRNVLVALEIDPAKVPAGVERIEEARKLFGDKDNLFLFFTTTEKVDDAKKALYLSLISKGWTKDELYAMVGVSPSQDGMFGMSPRGRGNLSKVLPPPPAAPMP